MEFKHFEINELCDICSSKRIYLSEYKSEGIPFYRGKEIIELSDKRQISNTLYIDKEKYLELKNKYGVPELEDIFVTAVGTLGKSWISDGRDFYFKDGNIIWIKNFNKEFIIPRFLLHLIKTSEFQNIINNIAIGSTQKAITIVEFKKIKLVIPEIDIQNKILKIITSIDGKIELNNQINNNLSLCA